MVDHLAATYGLAPEDAYVLSSLVVDLKISEIVDAGQYVVSALLPDAIFVPAGSVSARRDGGGGFAAVVAGLANCAGEGSAERRQKPPPRARPRGRSQPLTLPQRRAVHEAPAPSAEAPVLSERPGMTPPAGVVATPPVGHDGSLVHPDPTIEATPAPERIRRMLAEGRCVVLDGATGTELGEARAAPGARGAAVGHARAARRARRRCSASTAATSTLGCDVISTNTWGLPSAAAPRRPAAVGADRRPCTGWTSRGAGVRLARQAAGEARPRGASARSPSASTATSTRRRARETVRLLARAVRATSRRT